MYSDKLKTEKIHVPSASKDPGVSCIAYGVENVEKIIDGFCTKDDLIGVPTPKLFDLFDEFCKENGYPIFNRPSLGRVFRSHFGIRRKKVRDKKELYWVYVDGA